MVGSGTATGTPDTAYLSLSVDLTRPTAVAASSAAAAAAQAMLTAVEGQGVAAADVTTTGLNLNAITTSDPTSGPHITAYDADESFTVRVRDITKTSAVLQAAATAVGDDGRIGGVSFDLADRTALRAEARDAAVADARATASQYAHDTGHTLGGVMQVSEGMHSSGSTVPQPPAAPGAPPISTGQVEETVSVSVTYRLN
ncbi:SIMPL domain-containing protein [Catenulispora yoronensis]